MISRVLAKHWQVYGQTEMWKSWINAPFVQLLSSLLNSEKTKGSPDHACVFRGDFKHDCACKTETLYEIACFIMCLSCGLTR